MRLSKPTLILSILFGVCFANCSKPLILGVWKPQQITTNTESKGQVVMDLSNLDNLGNELFRASLDKYNANEVDSTSLMTNIESLLSNYQNIVLSIQTNNKFMLSNYNMLLLATIPGWHLSDTIIGEWSLAHDTLTLSIGEDKSLMNWKFKVMDLSSTNLRIQEIESYTKKDILFKRQ